MADEPFELARDRFGLLVLTDADGRRHVGVTPARAFPLTDPSRRIALCDGVVGCVVGLVRETGLGDSVVVVPVEGIGLVGHRGPAVTVDLGLGLAPLARQHVHALVRGSRR